MGIQVSVNKGEYRSGDDLIFQFTVDDEDNPPAVKDLTGATIIWVLSQRQGSTPLITKSAIGTEILVPTPTNGILQAIINAADTDNLSGGFWHELEITDSSGKVHTAAYGTFYIEPDTIVPAP